MKKIIKNGVLAEGEVTGHAHRVSKPVTELDNGVRTFTGPTIVEHEEHGPIAIPKRKMASSRVREYDHFQEEAKQVAD